MRMTDRGIAALKPKAERFEVWEGGRTGLGVRVSQKGRKSWVYMYRFGGKARRMGLGTYPLVGVASARVKHANAKALLEKGTDPGARQIDRKHAERTAETVADLIEEYLEKGAKARKRSAHEDERALTVEVKPKWRRRKAKDITRRDVIELLDGIVERGSAGKVSHVHCGSAELAVIPGKDLHRTDRKRLRLPGLPFRPSRDRDGKKDRRAVRRPCDLALRARAGGGRCLRPAWIIRAAVGHGDR